MQKTPTGIMISHTVTTFELFFVKITVNSYKHRKSPPVGVTINAS